MFGTYVPKVTYFGLTNAPPTFQRIIHQDLQPILQKYPKNFRNYLDDTWIVTQKTPEGRALHQQITHELFDLLENKSYFLKLGKCQFGQESMDLLGWTVGNGEIRINPNKITGLKTWPTELTMQKQAQVTMGLMNYIRPAIKGYTEMARPITEAMKKKNLPFKWTTECKEALERLIKIATSEPVLRCPDPEKPFELEVDASAFAVGAVLIQQDKQERQRHVGYFSKNLNETERNYDIWDREFMAVILALRFWRHLLQGSPHKVVVFMDHANLQYYRHPQKIN